MEEEELLLRAHIAVVALLGLLDAVLVLLQLLLVCTALAWGGLNARMLIQ